jgi:hypothetical protein
MAWEENGRSQGGERGGMQIRPPKTKKAAPKGGLMITIFAVSDFEPTV